MGDGASSPNARKERFNANTKEARRTCREKSFSKFTVVIFVVLKLTRRYNGVRGHMTGSKTSGWEQFLRRNTNKNRR